MEKDKKVQTATEQSYQNVQAALKRESLGQPAEVQVAQAKALEEKAKAERQQARNNQ